MSNEKKIIKEMVQGNLKVHRKRNLLLVLAITLTTILFTSVLEIGFGGMQSIQETQLRLSGLKADAELRYLNKEQFQKVQDADLFESVGGRIPIAFLEGETKRPIEIDYLDKTGMEAYYLSLEEGKMPEDEKEVLLSEQALEELGIEKEIGSHVPVSFTLRNQEYKFDMRLAGWYTGNSKVDFLIVSEAFLEHNPEVTENTYDDDKEVSGTYYANMDIPYFYLNTSGKSLFGSEGEKIEDYFEYTSLEHLKKKIVLLDEDDLKRQLMFMNIILTEINEFQVEDKKIELQQMKMIPHREKNKAHLLKAVQKLADSLIKTAVFNKDRTEVNWIGVTLIGNEDDCSWDIRPLGTYLYEGMSGLAIFFNALYTVDPQKEYLIICNAIEKELFTYTDEMCERNEGIENESSGAFGGEASIMYTYEVLYKITNKEKYLDYAKKHYKILKKAITRDNSFDLVYGNAGAVITLINMYQLTGNKEYIASAEIAGDIIVNAQEKEGSIKGGWNGDGRTSPLAGFSHGASGIVLALAKLWQVTQKEEYLLSLLDGIKFENSLFVKEKGNWKDERVYAGEKASDGGSFTVAWCHGAAGILLSRSKVNVILNGRYSDLIENDIKVAVNTILKEGILGNNCLCHGNLGNTEILFEYLKDHSDKKIEKYYVDIRDIIAENVCNGVFDCDNAYLYGYKLQGFMTGLCGMGYSLLRDIKKDLPCVIALEV